MGLVNEFIHEHAQVLATLVFVAALAFYVKYDRRFGR